MSGLGGVCTVTASTKRSVGGTTPTASISALSIMPLMPVSPEVVERYKLNSPRKTFYTCAEGTPDIKEGDLLVISAASYTVRAIDKLTGPVSFTGLYVEAVK